MALRKLCKILSRPKKVAVDAIQCVFRASKSIMYLFAQLGAFYNRTLLSVLSTAFGIALYLLSLLFPLVVQFPNTYVLHCCR